MSHLRRTLGIAASGALISLSLASWAAPAYAAGDRDGDGMPNRWELRHGLDPDRANAGGDADHDGLTNLREFRKHGDPRREDTDRDGQDDGDEVHDGFAKTSVDDPDGDDDGIKDGDEDSDHDGVDNEDEDDATESCQGDDDDRDGDHVADEDENDHGTKAGDDDSDDDGVVDGEEDSDDDGQANEDDDDSDEDHCGRHHGEDDDDLFGTIVSFTETTGDHGEIGTIVIDTAASDEDADRTYVVTEDTELEWDSSHSGGSDDDRSTGRAIDRSHGDEDEDEATIADLQPGTVVSEVDLDEDSAVAGALEEVELQRPAL